MGDWEVFGFLIILAVFVFGLYFVFMFLTNEKVRNETVEKVAEDFKKSPIDTVVGLAQSVSVFIFFGVLVLSFLQLVESGPLVLCSAAVAGAFWLLGWFTHGK